VNKFKNFGHFFNANKKSDPLSVEPFVKRRHMGTGAGVSMTKGKSFVPDKDKTRVDTIPEYEALKNNQGTQYIINSLKAKKIKDKIGDGTGITLTPHPSKPGFFILQKTKTHGS